MTNLGIRHSAALTRMSAAALALIACGMSVPAEAQPAPRSPLFGGDEPIQITIVFDFGAVLNDRAEERDDQPAILHEHRDGSKTEHSIGIRTRGYYRLHYLDCDVPPLRLNFKKNDVAGSIFGGQDKLKMVTHCLNGDERYQDHLFQEYLIYRAYNLLTHASFLTRLVHVTYVDSRARRESVTAYAFLIEDEDRMAERIGGSVLAEELTIVPGAIERDHMTRLAVFQYMIGNTDWTISNHHNVKLVFVDSTRTIVAVPYDFDWAGLISTPYATPFEALNIRSVRERKYMGPCRTDAELSAAFQQFRASRESIVSLFAGFPYLDRRHAERSVSYLEEFFDAIDGADTIRRDFARACR